MRKSTLLKRLSRQEQKRQNTIEAQKLSPQERYKNQIKGFLKGREEKLKNVCETCWLSNNKSNDWCYCKEKPFSPIKLEHNIIIWQHHKEWLRSTNTAIDVLNNCTNSRLLIQGNSRFFW